MDKFVMFVKTLSTYTKTSNVVLENSIGTPHQIVVLNTLLQMPALTIILLWTIVGGLVLTLNANNVEMILFPISWVNTLTLAANKADLHILELMAKNNVLKRFKFHLDVKYMTRLFWNVVNVFRLIISLTQKTITKIINVVQFLSITTWWTTLVNHWLNCLIKANAIKLIFHFKSVLIV